MNKWIITGIVGLVAVIGTIYTASLANQEVRVKTLFEAKYADNSSEFDNMKKKISQSAQVSDAAYEKLKEIFNNHATARTGEGDKGSMVYWVKESVPNVSTATMDNLMNIIVASRDAWTFRQKELGQIWVEHENIMRSFPSGMILGWFGRTNLPPMQQFLVTSTSTKEAFKTGEDNDSDVFGKKLEK